MRAADQPGARRSTRRADRRADRRRPAGVWAFGLAGLALVLVLGAAAVFRLASIRERLGDAADLIDAASVDLEAGQVGAAQAALEEARGVLLVANGDLHGSASLQLVGLLPGISENLDAVRSAISETLLLATDGARLLEIAEPFQGPNGLLELPLRGGVVPIELVSDARSVLEDLAADMPAPGDRPDSALLLSPVSDLVDQVYDEIDARRPQVENLSHGLALIQELAGGNADRRYLIAVANTAEMRGSGGMYLSYGVLVASSGELSLESFGGIDDLFLTEAVDPVPLLVPEDELGRWQGLEQTRLWRNVNLIPDFAAVAPRAMAMYEAATGLPVDGVIQIDPAGLGAILAGVGPVQLEEVGTVTAENVVALTLNEAYSLFPDRDQRQEVLGDVAEAAFDRLVNGDHPSLRPLGEALAAAAAQGHVRFFSPRPGARGPMAYFHTDGSIPSPDTTDYFLLTTQNRGRDKLDFYLESTVTVTGERPAGQPGTLTVEVVLTNTAPEGVTEPEYVFGGEFGDDVDLGTYDAIASLYVPNGTELLGPAEGVRVQREGGRTVLGWDVSISAGGEARLRFDLRLPPRPPGPYELDLRPIPRVHPTNWEVAVEDGSGAVASRSGPLERDEIVRATEG